MDKSVLEHFGLARDPFDGEPDPREFHPTRAHSAALGELGDAIRTSKPLTLFQGPDGAGKTIVLAALAEELPERFELILVPRSARRLGGLATAIAHSAGLPVDREREAREAFRAHVDARARAGECTAVAIDDAHTMPDHWVAELERLTAPEDLTVVVSCAGTLAATSRLPEAARLRERVVDTVRLRPLLESECSGYLQALLMSAGARDARLFDDEAVATLHELAGGLPGRISSIARRAMAIAFERGRTRVGEESVLGAAEELSDREPLPVLRAVKPAATDAPAADETEPSAPEHDVREFPLSHTEDLQEPMRAVAIGGGFVPPFTATGHTDRPHGPSRWQSGDGAGGSSTMSTTPSGPFARATEGGNQAGPRPVHAGPAPATAAVPSSDAPPMQIPEAVDPAVRREILAGARRPDRPTWDRSKTDPYRVATPAEAPFGADMLPVIADPHGDAAEWFRMVRMGIDEWIDRRGAPNSSVMVSSAEAEAGKTFVAVNLALLFANEPGLRVLIVDGDLRRPRFEALFGLPSRPGFADVIAGRAEMVNAMQYVSEVGLYVLPAGRAGNPRDLVSSDRLGPVLEEAKSHVDLVILDSPSLQVGVDARSMAAAVDGVLLVARSGQTRAPELVRAMRSLDRNNLIGAVVTDVQGQRAERGRGDRSRRG